jgi:hypothetical protein
VNSPPGEITRLSAGLEDRKEEAVPRLCDLLYQELRHVAQHHPANEPPDHALQATALVHEAYLRLLGEGGNWQGRAQLLWCSIERDATYPGRSRTGETGCQAAWLQAEGRAG